MTASRKYIAWDSPRDREIRLNIRERTGQCYTLPYATIILVQYIRPSLFLIMTSNYVITITGRNLDPLEELLQDEKVRSIQQFDERRHDRPADTDPVIQSIEVKWLRAEPPTPLPSDESAPRH